MNCKQKSSEKRALIAPLVVIAIMLAAMATTLSMLALPVSALVGPDVRITSSSMSNDLTPGGQASLTIALANLGVFDCAYKVTTQIETANPLSTTGLDSQIISSLCTPQAKNLSFYIKADPNAAVGVYPITLITTYESEFRADYTTSNTVYAEIKGAPEISAHVTGSSPVAIYADNDFSLDITLDNTGAYRADSLGLELAAEAPIEVRPSTATQSAATIQARSSTTKTFYLRAPKNTEARQYRLSLNVSYIDENGEWNQKTIPLGITISRNAVLEASDGASASLIDTRNNELRFNLKNTGSDSAKRLRVKLLPSFPFSTQGSVQYLEEIAPNQQKQLSFYVDVDAQGIPGEYALDLSVSYENSEGDSFTDTIPISTRAAYVPIETTLFYNYWYLWVLAIAAIVFLVMKKRKGKKE